MFIGWRFQITNMADNTKFVKCYCDTCERETNHAIKATVEVTSPDEEYWWHCDYSIVKCCGCGTVSFLTATTEEGEVEYNEYGEVSYPTKYKTFPYHRRFAKSISDVWSIPRNISKIYKETINALNNECFLLAAAGFRVIVEAICIENKIEGKSLETKINNLCKKGIITKNDRDRLHSIRFMGNDSVHAIKEPDKRQIRLVLDIIHNMLNGLYVLTKECEDILEGPITEFDEFIELLEEGLKTRSVGEVDILKNLLPPSRRLISEDRSTFENQLKEAIANGKFTKLELCPPPANGRNQQYKVLSL